MGVNRNTAAIVADGDGVICVQLHFDAIGVARHRLIH